ncbi:hypothetical protein HOD29_03915 [archaeon]|jgi:hypothetical protein|nr:hypothetical protein [archaeon]
MNKKLILIFGVILTLGLVSAAVIGEDLHLNIQTTDAGGNVVTGTFAFVFNVTTDASCSAVVYSNSTSLTTDNRGIVSYYLENVALDYNQQYWLCYYRDGSLINNSKIARTPYAFRARNVTLSGIEVDRNFDLGSYNMTAQYYFGDGSKLTNINVSEIDLAGYVPYTGSLANIVLGDFNFSVGTSDFFVDASSGRVGIGTGSPVATLEVGSTGVSSLRIHSDTDDDSNVDSYIQLGRGNTPASPEHSWYLGFDADDSDKFKIGNGGNQWKVPGGGDLFTIQTDGNVGIGITDPSSLLVVGGIETSGTGGNIQVKSDVNDYAITLEENSGAETWQFGINSAGDLGFSNSFAGYSSIIFDDSGNLLLNVTNSYLKMARADGFSSEILHVDSSTDNLIIGDSTLDEMHFDVDNMASAMMIDQNGKIGIGTTSPAVPLDVQSGVNDSIVASFGVDPDNRISLYDYESGGFRSIYAVDDGSYGSLNLGHATSPYLFVETGGQVGIGTASPSEALDVQGNISASGYFIGDGSLLTGISGNLNSSGWNRSGTDVYLANSGDSVGLGTASPNANLHINDSIAKLYLEGATTADTDIGQLVFYNSGDSVAAVISKRDGANDAGDLRFLTQATGESPTERLYIQSDGKIGIGTTSPSALFHVNGSATPMRLQGTGSGVVDFEVSTSGDFTIDAADDIRLDTGGSDVVLRNAGTEFGRLTKSGDDFQISSSVTNGDINLIPNGNGNVGIGTSSPSYDFHVNGSDPQFYLTAYGYTPIRTMLMRPATGGIDTSVSLKLNANTDQDIIMATGGGNVGIGTSSPSRMLELKEQTGTESVITFTDTDDTELGLIGMARATDSLVTGSSNLDMVVGGAYTNSATHLIAGGAISVTLLEGGNVGIGTTSPTAPLHVNRTDASVAAGLIVEHVSQAEIDLKYGSTSATIAAASDKLYFSRTGSAWDATLTSTGLGIGTSSPQRELHVVGDILANGTINATGDLCIEGGNCLSTLPSSGIVNGSGTQNYLAKFSDSDSLEDSVIYDDGSSVGIGTDSPVSKLHINGSTGASGGLSFGDGDTKIFELIDDIFAFNANSITSFYASSGSTQGGVSQSWQLSNSIASATTPNIIPNRSDTNTGIGTAGGDILSLIAGGVNGLNVDSTGKVGIGTVSPGNYLHIGPNSESVDPGIRLSNTNYYWDIAALGTSSGDQDMELAFSLDGGTPSMVLQRNGNVGIGTVSPSQKLHIEGTDDVYVQAKSTGANSASGLILQNDARNWVLRNNADVFQIRDATADAQRMVIDTAGQVGINESSPEAMMHVTGDVIIEL